MRGWILELSSEIPHEFERGISYLVQWQSDSTPWRQVPSKIAEIGNFEYQTILFNFFERKSIFFINFIAWITCFL